MPVEITIDGKTQTKKTDDAGRVQVTDLKPGTKVRVVTVVDGERLESREITIAKTGIRVVLVGVDPEAEKRAAEDRALAAGPPVKGVVVFGPESRVHRRDLTTIGSTSTTSSTFSIRLARRSTPARRSSSTCRTTRAALHCSTGQRRRRL